MISSHKFAALAALAGVCFTSAPVVRSAIIDVTVGGAGGILKYNPEFVNASIGDIVQFTFQQKNHTATQSTFSSPCSPATNGFDSGFVPVADNATSGFPIAQLTIENTDPVWVYCRQANHCQQGMVFAVNPGDKFSAFQAAATGANSTATSTSVTSTASAASVVTVTATVTVSGGEALTTTYGSYPGSAAPTSASTTDHKVTVGADGQLVYSPANITAQVGDTVTFEFHQKNHTVTQSSFADPCRALALTSTTGQTGFDSGFMPVAANATTFPTYTVQINDTQPVWVYCRQTGHCGMGMVFSVNAIESGANNFDAFKAKAIQLNGTSASGSATSSSPSATSSSNSASGRNIRGAGTMIALLGAVVGALL